MASGAGLNRVGQYGGRLLLSASTAVTPVATPLTGYGTIGGSDSGPIMWEGIGFSKWGFQILGGGTGYSVSVYGTLDPVLFKYLDTPGTAGTPQALALIVPASSWFLLPAPSSETGTGADANPMVAANPTMLASRPLVAVRAVVTATATPTGVISVVGFATP